MYEEIVHIPLFIHDPRKPGGRRIPRLTQPIDVAPTFLDLYGVSEPPETEEYSLLSDWKPAAVLFGYFGGAVNVTDGRYTYHRFPADIEKQEIFQYTLMPNHMAQRFTPEELSSSSLAAPFGWTKQVPLLRGFTNHITGRGTNLPIDGS
jgi:arylsulfatase A-like enzyme